MQIFNIEIKIKLELTKENHALPISLIGSHMLAAIYSLAISQEKVLFIIHDMKTHCWYPCLLHKQGNKLKVTDLESETKNIYLYHAVLRSMKVMSYS